MTDRGDARRFEPRPRSDTDRRASTDAENIRNELQRILHRCESVIEAGRESFAEGAPHYDVASMVVIRLAALLERPEFANLAERLTPDEITAIKATRNIASHAGYVGMNDPRANNPVIVNTGAQSPDGGISFMDPNGMSATPYLYLIPVGQDYMRTPPLGDTSQIRSWKVADISLPLPFNIGASDYSSTRYWQSSESLSEDLFAIRKHQAFRAVSDPEVFNQMTNGMDNYTNNRLIGRSVWNNRWKLIIPGRSLLKNPEEGIERFIRSIEDIKLHFKTYSYSGN